MKNTKSKAGIRKEEILNAALKCFNKKGYYKTAVEDIAKKIGITKAAIYYYFKTKKDIFIKLFHFKVYNYFDEISKNIHYTSNDPIGYYNKRIQTSDEIFKKNIDVFKFCLEFITVSAREPDIKKEVTHFYEHRIAEFSTTMERGIQDGKFYPCDTESIAVIFYFLSMGFFLTYFSVNKNIYYEKHFNMFFNMLYKEIIK